MANKNKRKFLPILVIAAAIVLLSAAAIVFDLVKNSRIEVYEDVTRYEKYMSFDNRSADPKWHKWGMDESIWPRKITDAMGIAGYKMVYYDPWDAQYLGWLAVDYPPEEYAAEMKRLREYPSTEYIGYYGVREETAYELAAVFADPYHGFVYALTDGRNRIIYAEQIFCNYFLDLDPEQFIPGDYLLEGFDASRDNPYRNKMLSR